MHSYIPFTIDQTIAVKEFKSLLHSLARLLDLYFLNIFYIDIVYSFSNFSLMWQIDWYTKYHSTFKHFPSMTIDDQNELPILSHSPQNMLFWQQDSCMLLLKKRWLVILCLEKVSWRERVYCLSYLTTC